MSPPRRDPLGEPPAGGAGAGAVSRRRLIQAAAGVLGGSVAAVALGDRARPTATAEPSAAPPVPEPARARSFTPQLFTLEQALLVEALADCLIPESDSPGALAAGVPAYIEDIVGQVHDDAERQRFLQALDATAAEARAAHGRPFHECDGPQRDALIARWLERSAPSLELNEPWDFFQELRALCIEGFCRSRLGATRVLQYEGVPGQYRGCVPLSEVGRAWATS